MGKAGVNPDPGHLGVVDIRFAVEVNGEWRYGHIWPDPTVAPMECGLPTSFIVYFRDTGSIRLNWTSENGWKIRDDDPLLAAVAEFLIRYYC